MLPGVVEGRLGGDRFRDCATMLREGNMARRRFQATGHLYESPSGEWRHQHWADVIDDRGKRVPKRRDERVGPAKGPGKMTRKQAWAHVQQHILPRVNAERQQAESGLTLAGFVEARFLREYVSRKRPATQIHYAQRLKHDILPVLGGMLLADIEYSHILECVYRVTERGRSTQTAAHVRNCLSAIFKHAKLSGHFHGENPARYHPAIREIQAHPPQPSYLPHSQPGQNRQPHSQFPRLRYG